MTHLDAGTLVAYMDRALEVEEQAFAREHVDRCEACRTQLLRLQQRSGRLSSLLDAADPVRTPVPSRWITYRRVAAIAFLVGAGVSARPVGAWMATMWSGRDSGSETRVTDVSPAGGRVSFEIGETLTLRFATFQVGVLEVRSSGNDAGHLSVEGSGVSVMVAGDRLDVDNEARPSPTYVLEVPVSLRRLVVQVGSTVVGDREISGPGSVPFEVNLAASP